MSQPFISRGFRGRRRQEAQAGRLPPGQYLTRDFPVLSAGPTPRVALAAWDFALTGEVEPAKRWTWDEFRALPREAIAKDIHCVTKWSKFEGRPAPGWRCLCDGGTRAAGGRHRKAWIVAYDGSPWRPSTAGRRGCWCRTSTSGRAPNGSGLHLSDGDSASGSRSASRYQGD